MYCYKLFVERHYIDYYTDERTIYPETCYKFSDASVWAARFRLILSLIKTQRATTIVDFYQIRIELTMADQEVVVPVGSWFLRTRQNAYQWDWKTEADFLEKNGLYRQGDKELLAIEQAFHQVIDLKENTNILLDLEEKLKNFTEKFADTIDDYATEVGILYFLLNNYSKVFEFFSTCPKYYLKSITHHVAFKLSYLREDADYEYMKKYDALYDNDRPFLDF